MSDDRAPAVLEALVRSIAAPRDDDDDQRATTFARGLGLGALVGAAIAGSTIWSRRRAQVAATVTATDGSAETAETGRGERGRTHCTTEAGPPPPRP